MNVRFYIDRLTFVSVEHYYFCIQNRQHFSFKIQTVKKSVITKIFLSKQLETDQTVAL